MSGQIPARLALVVLLVVPIAPFALAAEEEPETIRLDDETILLPIDQDAAWESEPGAGPGAAPSLQNVDPNVVLSGLWFKQRAFRERGQTEQAARQIEVAIDFMRRSGVRTAPDIAAAFLAQGRRALDNGDYPAARENFALAARFQPTLSTAYGGLGLSLLRGERDLGGAAGAWWRGFANLFADPGSLYFLAANGILILYAALCLGIVAALLVLCLRSVPAFSHDLEERSAGRLTEESARLLGWILLAVPILLPIAPAWAIAVWAALFAAYFRPSGKAVAAAALLLLMLAGPVGVLLGWTFGTAVDPGARALIHTMRQGPDLQHERALQRLTAQHEDEPMYPFLLASAYRSAGRHDDAVVMYRRVLDMDPGHGRALVNLGNIHALRQEYAIAQKYYQRAWGNEPGLALAHYNSHLAHLEVFHLEAADAELRESRRLNETLINDLLQEGTAEGARRVPVDTSYTSLEIWDRVTGIRRDGGGAGAASGIARSSATLAGGIGLLTLLVVPGLGLVPRRASARRCRRCGRPYCRRCQVASRFGDVCAQCTHLFILRDGLAPGVKSKKMEEVARYRRRHFLGARLLGLVAPGSGHVLGGRTLKGCVLLVIWFFALCGLLLRGRVLIAPEELASAGWSGIGVMLVVLGLLAWLTGNLSAPEARRD